MNLISVAFIVAKDIDTTLAILWLVIAWMLLIVFVCWLAYKMSDKDE